MQELPGQVQRLSDGSALELRGTTYGKHHLWQEGSAWQRINRWVADIASGLDWIPGASQYSRQQLAQGTSAGEFDTADDRFALWLRQWYRKPSGSGAPVIHAAAVDAHGCRLHCSGLDSLSHFDPRGENLLHSETFPIVLDAYPRREPKFRIRFFDEGGHPAGQDFLVANPARKFEPAWHAKSCPAEAQNGPLRVVLRNLSHARISDPYAISTAQFE